MKVISRIIQLSKSILLLTLFSVSVIADGMAQLYPLGAQYFHNQYLGNPAMAGMEKGFLIGLSHRKQWNDVPGSPVNQMVTGEYRSGRVGLGVNVNKEKEGLMNNARVVGTFAYHLPINDRQQLHLGLSMGLINQRLRSEDIVGEQGDVSVSNYNNREIFLDGDYGMAFTDNKLKLQLAIPNLKNFFDKDFNRIANISVFYAAASYKISNSNLNSSMVIEPILALRGVKGFRNIWNAGSNFSFSENRLNLLAIYHSTGNGTYGLAFNYNEWLGMSTMYTTGTSVLKGFNSTGDFEINLRFTF